MWEPNYLLSVAIHHAMLAAIAFWLGVWACVGGVRVNYTRKLNHFAVFFIPMALAPLLPYHATAGTLALSTVIFLATTLLFVAPVRRWVAVVDTAFASIDRPEDRPYTLFWILSQYAAASLILGGLFLAFRSLGRPELVAFPLLVTAVGDGLAEPVGVRWGRHTYRVPTLTGSGSYVRSWEGSAAVAVSTLAIVLLFASRGAFTTRQTVILAATMPAAMTAAEARSPHSWDAPMLYLVGGGGLLAVVAWW